MKVAILGAYGQLGSEICRQLGDAAVPIGRDACDLTHRDAVQKTLAELRPDIVINAAAYNQVDRAEQEIDTCRAINAHSVGFIAEACGQLDCALVQVSTAYVFGGDGQRSVPYGEDEQPQPLSVYGQTKYEGEIYAAQIPRHYIVRTGGMFGLRRCDSKAGNFVDLMLRLGQTEPVVRVVKDQVCGISHVMYVARAIRFLLMAQSSGPKPYGIYHVANQGATTWHAVAAEVFRQTGLRAQLKPVSTADFGAAAARPAYAVLDTAKYRSLGGPELPDWRQALTDYLQQLGDSWRLRRDEDRKIA